MKSRAKSLRIQSFDTHNYFPSNREESYYQVCAKDLGNRKIECDPSLVRTAEIDPPYFASSSVCAHVYAVSFFLYNVFHYNMIVSVDYVAL